jgi:hypothetical protein
MHYNGLEIVFYILLNINMVPKLNHPFLTCWNHYSWITFYIHNKLHARPHWNELVIFHIFLTFNMCIWIEPFNFNMLKLLLTSYILHVLKYIETHAIQCILTYLTSFVNFTHLLNYQHLYMSRIMHFKPIETITQMLHITFIILYWNTHNLMPHIYIWMG